MAKDSAAGIELGRSFHQEGTVNEIVSESDSVPLWDTLLQCCTQCPADVISYPN